MRFNSNSLFRNIFLLMALISSLLLTACGGGGGGGGGTPAPTQQTSSVKVTIPGSLFPKQATEVRAATSLEKLTLKVVAYSNGKEKTDVKITDREATSNGTNFTATVDGLLNVYDYRFKVFHNNTELLSNQVAASEIVNDANITINIETSYKTIAYDSWLKKKPTNASMSNFKENSKTAGFTKDSDYKKLTLTIGNDEYTADQYKENLIKAAKNDPKDPASLPTDSNAKINVDKIATTDKEPEIVTYTISYNLDGGTLSKANPTKYGSASATITLNNPTKDGYNFTGWTGSNGNTPQTTVTIPKGSTGNKTFKANWEKQATQYDVSLFYGVWVDKQGSFNLEGNIFSNANYQFFPEGNFTGYAEARDTTDSNSKTIFWEASGKFKFEKNSISLTNQKYTLRKAGETPSSKFARNISDITYEIISFDGSTIKIKYTTSSNIEKTAILNKDNSFSSENEIKQKIVGLFSKYNSEVILFNSDNTFVSMYTEIVYTGNYNYTGILHTLVGNYTIRDYNVYLEGDILSREPLSIVDIDDNGFYDSNQNGKTPFTREKLAKNTDIKKYICGGWGYEDNEQNNEIELMFYKDGTFFCKNTLCKETSFDSGTLSGKYKIENNVIVCYELDDGSEEKLYWIPSEISQDKLVIYCKTTPTELTKLKDVSSLGFGGGSGTQQDPYLIKTPDQLDNIRYNCGKYFKQVNDIDVSSLVKEKGWNPINFYGFYDGNHKKITGIWINNTFESGLFGNIEAPDKTNSVIKNMIIEYDKKGIKSDYSSGGIVGNAKTPTEIISCYVKCDIDAGGLYEGVGGIVGLGDKIIISNCCYTGNITSSNASTGGIIGSFDSGNISNCFTVCNINLVNTYGGITSVYGGGISGSNGDEVFDCYSASSITGSDNTSIDAITYGGVNCLAINPKLQSKFIDIIGDNCYYWDKIQIVGNLNESDSISVEKAKFWGSSTKESFWKSSNYLNWTDFDTNWEFRSGYNLPQLKNLPSIKEPDGIN